MWVDAVIIFAIMAAAAFGYRRGALATLSDVAGIVVISGMAFLLYPWIATSLRSLFKFDHGLASLLGFVIAWGAIQFLWFGLTTPLVRRLPQAWRNSLMNKWGGVVAGALRAVCVWSILLAVFISLPLAGSYKDIITNAPIAHQLLLILGRFQGQIADAIGFDERLADALITAADEARTAETWGEAEAEAVAFCRASSESPLFTTPACPRGASTLEEVSANV